jgi:hypothetical protein
MNNILNMNWDRIEEDLDKKGYATTNAILNPSECKELIDLYADDRRFRSRINMEQFRFGVGEYKYFANPLPEIVQKLRADLYPPLAKIATRWNGQLGEEISFAKTLQEYLKACHAKGQTKPTPLMLKYESGGYNCLHQDLYGEIVFPFQCTVLLSSKSEYEGGEFLLVEQRPRAQSRGEAISCEQGEMIIFPVRDRPVCGTRGFYRTIMRHGVSTIRSGNRFTLGIIFHDAK